MPGAFSQVDLSQLAPPAVVEALDFETILADMVADLRARDPAFTALVESDPAFAILEVAAYRELLIRQRVNDAARAVMIAYATGPDLDHIAANYAVKRLLIAPADGSTIPPTAAIYETDADFRARVVLSLEGYTSAGSQGSYVFHALSASGDCKDISATSPSPGHVTVYVLSRQGDGTAPPDLIDTVEAALNGDKVRPMTDNVTVMSAAIVGYEVEAELTVYPGPDSSVVLEAAQLALTDYVTAQHRMGYDITLSGIYAALHQPGVQRVDLVAPTADLVVGEGEAAFCTAMTVTVAALPDV